MTRPLLVVDGTNILHRCVAGANVLLGQWAPAAAFFTRVKDEVVAVTSFFGSRPEVAVAFDGTTESWRRQMFPWYKANRRKPAAQKSPEFWARLNFMRKAVGIVVASSGARHLTVDGFEGDDILAAACYGPLRPSPDTMVAVMSGDEDVAQLLRPFVESAQGAVLWCRPGGPRWTDDQYAAANGFRGAQLPVIMAMSGDTSDNIPGVKGLGPKRALGVANACCFSLELIVKMAAGEVPNVAQQVGDAAARALTAPKSARAIVDSWHACDLRLAPALPAGTAWQRAPRPTPQAFADVVRSIGGTAAVAREATLALIDT